MAFAALSRSARLAGLSAAALLALTACGGQDSSDADADADASASASAQGSESSSASASSLSAAPADYEAGTCFTAPLGARDLSSFETADCEGAHTAEYLWAVPAVAEGEEADPAAAQACTAQAQRLSEEKEDQLNGTVLTSSELGNYGTDEKHCVVYGVSGEWEGQIVDPEITLEAASADA